MTAPLLTGTAPAPLLPTAHLLGHLPAFRQDPLAVFVQAWRTCGDVARIPIVHKDLFLLAHPSHVQRVLVENADNYVKGTRGQVMLRRLLGDGLLTSQGAIWKQHRRAANPAFRRKMIAGFAETMGQSAADLAAQWAGQSQPVDVVEGMSQLTLQVAGQCFFSQDIQGEAGSIGHALTTVLEEFNRIISAPLPGWERLPTPGNLRYQRAAAVLDQTARHIIAARRAEGTDRDDLLGMLLSAEDPQTGARFSDQDLRDEVLTMLLAGHETTASTLAWTLIELSRHPVIARQVEAEIDAVVGDDLPSPAQARQLTLTGQVISESMRLHPPAWVISRQAVADDVIDGCSIPAGSFVFLCPYLTHRHPDFWHNPEGFDPERFSHSLSPDGTPRPRTAFLPFGAGQRKCIGSHFAELEARVVLAVMLRRLRLSLAPAQTITPSASVTLRPEGAVWMQAAARG